MPADFIECWGDACVEPINPGGTAAYGILIKRDHAELYREGHLIGRGPTMSNNVAEYSAMCAILDYLLTNKIYGATLIRMDSKLVINQLNGIWKVKGGLYLPFYYKAKHLLAVLRDRHNEGIRLQWIPRDQNSECDEISKNVLRRMGVKFRLHPEPVHD